MKEMDLHWDHGEHGARSNMANSFTPRPAVHVACQPLSIGEGTDLHTSD